MGTSSGTSPPQEVLEVADRLHSAAIHLLRRARARDGELGLSGPRLSALSVVVFAGPLTVSELAAAEQVRPPTMTRMVDALQRAALVSREPNPRDGRSVLVRATATGVLVLSRGRSRRVEDLAAHLRELHADELDTLAAAAALMERIAALHAGGPGGHASGGA
ncbi:MAG: MarR family transcriptional regulator [Actinobacteria bacterium]|nr:MarR family transcriptional regulator [Actinomycetota bacterium]